MKLYALHYVNGFGTRCVEVVDSLEEAKSRKETEDKLDIVRFGIQLFKFIEVILDEARLLKLVEKSINDELCDWLYNENAFACCYDVMYAGSVIEYVGMKQPGHEVLKRAYAKYFVSDEESRADFDYEEWTISVIKHKKNKYTGESPTIDIQCIAGWDYEGQTPLYGAFGKSSKDIIEAYENAIDDMANHNAYCPDEIKTHGILAIKAAIGKYLA